MRCSPALSRHRLSSFVHPAAGVLQAGGTRKLKQFFIASLYEISRQELPAMVNGIHTKIISNASQLHRSLDVGLDLGPSKATGGAHSFVLGTVVILRIRFRVFITVPITKLFALLLQDLVQSCLRVYYCSAYYKLFGISDRFSNRSEILNSFVINGNFGRFVARKFQRQF
jgi:hypothetical protein